MPLANVDSPRGFSPVMRGGHAESKRIRRSVLANRADNLMIGDAYTLDAAGNAARAIGAEGSPDVVRGIVEGIDLNPIAASPQGPVSQDYIPNTEAGAIIGIEDPEAEFVVQMDNFNAAADVGSSFDHDNSAGDSILLRQSRQFLNEASLGLAGVKNFDLISVLDSPADNSPGNFAKVVVRMNHTL